VKVTDANLCNTSATINLTQPAAALALGKTGDVALLCFGDTNGTGTFTASEAQPLTHLALPAIQLGQHEHDSDHVELYERWSRSITVKVTDANLCNTSATINLTQPAAALALGKTGDVALLCFWRYEWYRHIHSKWRHSPLHI